MVTRTMEKMRKKITKRKGPLGAVHEGSRDSRRLRFALTRDTRLEKLQSTRKKAEQPMVDRVCFFLETIRETGLEQLDVEQFQAAVNSFVRQHDEEMAEIKAARRPGRPATSREDLVRLVIANLEKEYQNGFLVPDLGDKENVETLQRWDGSWLNLTSLKWVRINETGVVKPAAFPPNKD